MTRADRIDRMLGYGTLAALVVGCLVVLLPFVTALLLAVILTYSTWPLYVRLRKGVGGRSNLAAGLMMLLPVFGEPLAKYWQNLSHDGVHLLENLKGLIAPAKSVLVMGGSMLFAGLLQLGLSVLVAFFLYRDGEAAAAKIARITGRLGGSRGHHLLNVAGSTVTSVVYGILGTALAQGLVAGIGFVIAGVPGAALLGFATFFLSVVPVGPPLIWIPAAIWLFVQGSTGWAIFMGLWGLLVISMVDNVLKPMIISRGSHLPFMLVLLGVLGGVAAFGFVGIFLGPTLLAVGYRMVNEWVDGEVEGP
jgi:predicted PurR-regulated permease PerM